MKVSDFCEITTARQDSSQPAPLLELGHTGPPFYKPYSLVLAQFPKGSILAIDRGYVDYEQFARWTESGIFFVTREKDNAAYRVIEKREVPDRKSIIKDQLIKLTGYESIKTCPHALRRIEVWDAENERVIVLWTNHLTFGATTIARIYKDRWQIEIFFKMIK